MKKYLFVVLVLLLIALVISCDDIAKPDNPDIPDDTSVVITLDPNVEGKKSVTRSPEKDGKVNLPNGVDLWGDVGFAFKGWATTKDGSVVYKAGVSIAFKKSQTLYAVWNKSSSVSIPFTITYWVNNGTDVSIPKNYEAGANPKILDCEDEKETIKKEGYTFKSWNTSQDGSGTSYDINIPYDGHGDLTLYAQWIEIDPMLTFDTFGNESRVVRCKSEAVNVTIPEYYQGRKVTIVASKAFYRKGLLETVSFPNTITTIGDEAFYYCNKLDNVTLPDSLESIGKSAFHYCDALTTIKIPNRVATIGERAFSLCKSLKNITIPESVTELKDYLFDLAGLESIILPNKLETIGNNAFARCISLKSIKIPNTVTSIGKNAFERCLELDPFIFQGLSSEWNNIQKGDSWNREMKAKTVQCTDMNIN